MRRRPAQDLQPGDVLSFGHAVHWRLEEKRPIPTTGSRVWFLHVAMVENPAIEADVFAGFGDQVMSHRESEDQ